MTLADFRARWAGHVPEIQDVKQEYAVLVPLVEGPEGLSLLFEVRASTLAHQPGEVCFPGGKVERGESPRDCALRETFEELAIPAGEVEIISPLDLLVQLMDGYIHQQLLRGKPLDMDAVMAEYQLWKDVVRKYAYKEEYQ